MLSNITKQEYFRIVFIFETLLTILLASWADVSISITPASILPKLLNIGSSKNLEGGVVSTSMLMDFVHCSEFG